MRIRKQVYDLTRQDLRHHALWEFCLDEEGVPGQDEATIKPSASREVPAFSPGAYIVAADFVFADGSVAEGYICSGEPEDFACTQPTIILDDGEIKFWFGIRVPSADRLIDLYHRLGKTAEAVFPVRYTTRVPINGRPISGVVEGFGTLTIKDPSPRMVR